MNYSYYQISKKSVYAIEALLELALQGKSGPVNVRKLADSRQIPVRFLEVILNELKQGGFVRSFRGKSGGYRLTESPKDITIGQVLLFLDKLSEVGTDEDKRSTALKGLISDVNKAVGELFENISIQDLADIELRDKEKYIANYSI